MEVVMGLFLVLAVMTLAMIFIISISRIEGEKKMYEELIERLRNAVEVKRLLEQAETHEILTKAADAIEELSEKLNKINSLKHNGYYTGTYIKALMEMEE